MRLLVTADLHFNHGRSRALAEQVIADMNAAGGDVLLVVGDTAAADGTALEECLSLFRFAGPRLFVAGNHELWTGGADSYTLFTDELPRRVRAMGWRWLQTETFVAGDLAIVGSVGWYDYSFAREELGIPRRFYQHKLSPGAARRFAEFAHLLNPSDDVAPDAQQILARWNDGKFVKLHRADEAFLDELLTQLARQLESVRNCARVAVAVHHVPFHELLPPMHSSQWDFARAYLGSAKIGQTVAAYPNVRHLFCGHSHFPVDRQIGPIHARNIGSGYRFKTFCSVEL